jgi:hypothetical protein
MEKMGGKNLRVGADGTYVAGWVGLVFSNIAAVTEYLIVAVIHQRPGSLLVTCSARPRMTWGLAGRDRSREHIDRLVENIRGAGLA